MFFESIKQMPVILASQSPRRREILEMLAIPFTVMVSHADETCDPSLSPAEQVQLLATRKAEAVAALSEAKGHIIIAADTLVEAPNGEILGKPTDEADALRMLRALAGSTHAVYSGVALHINGTATTAFARTEVVFRPTSEAELLAYLATGEPLDKAGAYGIQERGALFVKEFHGEYFNVVGLPIHALDELFFATTGLRLSALATK